MATEMVLCVGGVNRDIPKLCLPGNANEMKNAKITGFGFLMFIYAVAMTLFLVYQPPIVQILMRNTLWFRKASPNRTEYQNLEQAKFNGGYMKIIFYFYQIASCLAIDPVSHVFETVPFVSFFSGLLNFHPKIATRGFGCPFPGLNVVTKELLLSLSICYTSECPSNSAVTFGI